MGVPFRAGFASAIIASAAFVGTSIGAAVDPVAQANASVSTVFSEHPGRSDFDSDLTEAGASASDGFEGASASGFATARGTRIDQDGNTVTDPFLFVYATGSQNGDGSVGGTATSFASWTDHLTYQNPAIVDPPFLSLNPFVYYVMTISGTISNKQPVVATLHVTSGNGDVYEDDLTVTGPLTFPKVQISLKLPANALLDAVDPNTGEIIGRSTLLVGLTVTGGTDLDNVDGTSDFSHTFELSAIYVADTNGNYIPGSENIVIAGDNGPYQMTIVPEPETWLLLGWGMAGGVLARRSRVMKASRG